MLREANYYSKMALGWWKFIRTPTAPDAREVVRQGLLDREINFLGLLKRGVFESDSNPYRQLFAWAGCEYGDAKGLVAKEGLEVALEQLRRAGIYLTHDEFKGKTAVVRGQEKMQVSPGDFSNTLVRGLLKGSSSGSRSQGTISPRSVEHEYHRETQEALYWEEFNLY